MFCPQCNEEYRPGFTLCADCGIALVEEGPPPPPPEVLEVQKKRESDDRTAGLLILLGFGLGVVGILVSGGRGVIPIGGFLLLAGYAAGIAGSCLLARAKGYSPALGFIAVLGLLPAVIILVLPEKKIEAERDRNIGWMPADDEQSAPRRIRGPHSAS